MRWGVVYFDAALDRRAVRRQGAASIIAREGWAAIDGREAFRITKIADLPSDTVWMSNLEADAYRSNGLSKSPNHVPNYYLKTDVRQIAAEIGADTEHERVSVIVQALSEVFSRTMRLVEKYYGTAELGLENNRKKLEFLLAQSVGRKTHAVDAGLNQAMEQAWQKRVYAMGQPIPRNWWQCTLRRNRYVHAYEVLDTPVPSSHNWEFVDVGKMPEGNKARLDWLCTNDKPVLARIRVADGRGLEAQITSFGSKANASLAREWVCGPELYWLSKYYSTIEVQGAYICNDGYVPPPELRKFPPPNDFCLSSISMGLLTENFLAFMYEPTLAPMGQTAYYYPHAVWYTTMDRFFCFAQTTKLIRLSTLGGGYGGFRFSSYGNGNLQIAVPAEMIDEMTDMAAQCGWEVPSSAYWKRTQESRKVME